MSDVWVVVVGGGWYENPTVFGAYSNPEIAIEHIKDKHQLPYIVKWYEAFRGQNYVTLIGDFDYVPEYSVRHSEEFTITKWKINE